MRDIQNDLFKEKETYSKAANIICQERFGVQNIKG